MNDRNRSLLQILALILILLALALGAWWVMRHHASGPAPAPAAPIPAVLPKGILPDRGETPGAIDPAVSEADICDHDWAPGNPPKKGGDLTYSQAARHTSAHLKNAVFAGYGLTNPHDGGKSYEIDHLVPLALGGRDVQENLWPESRTAPGLNAWAKDRLEYRLYRLVCDPAPGGPRVTLREVQDALRLDWPRAYRTYCPTDDACPQGGGD